MAERDDYREVLTAKIIEQLEAGTAPWQKPWNPASPGEAAYFLPYNPTTNQPYRGANSLYLTAVGESKGYGDPRWMTYKQAQAQGYQVRRGEKGALVEYWKFTEERPLLDEQGKPVLDEHGKQKSELVQLDRPRVFRAVVFNAKQMDGVPELAKERAYGWNPEERAEQILTASGARIIHDQADRAFYTSGLDQIHLPPKSQFPDATAYYSTSLHELGHWTGHKSRLDRDLAHPFGSEGYAKEELRAELASYFLADRLGIPHDPGQHAAYVKSWIQALREDKNEIFRAARDAERITDYVLGLDRERNQKIGREGKDAHEMTFQEFSDKATVVKLENHGRQWEVFREGKSFGFSDAATPALAIREAHFAEVNNAVFSNLPELPADKRKSMPPPAVLAEYPELREKFPELLEQGRAETRTYLEVPFREKEAAKALGAKWDKGQTSWYVPAGVALEAFEKWIPKSRKVPDPETVKDVGTERVEDSGPDERAKGRVVLNVPFREKEAAKALGAQWDKGAKAWYAPEGADLTKLNQWIPNKVVALDPVAEFRERLFEAGLIIKGNPIMDGQRHRVPVADGKKGALDGMYIGHLDGKPAGYFENFKTGVKGNWVSGRQLTPDEAAQIGQESQRNSEKKAAKLAEQHEHLAGIAEKRWRGFAEVPPGGQNGYLVRKQVSGHGVRFDGEKMVIPLRDVDGKLWSLQYVAPEEGAPKHLLKNAKKEGRMHVIGKIEPGLDILVAEGYATAASAHEASRKPTVMAVDSGNLDAVVGELRGKYLTNRIFILADDDRENAKNVGIEKALAAAEKHRVGVIIPQFQGSGKDWNDLHVNEGITAVRSQIEAGIGQSMDQSRKEALEIASSHLGPDFKEAKAGPNTRHSGPVIGTTSYHTIQEVGGGSAVIHRTDALNDRSTPGQNISVQYQDGRGQVSIKPDRQRGQKVDMSR
jgi:putative DNA primase/helicase